MTLPKLGAAGMEPPTESLAPINLGPAQVPENALVIVNLKGGASAVKGGRQKFEFTAAMGGTATRDWEVTLVGGEAPVIVALLSAKENQFTFQWTPDGAKQQFAPNLCNCALDISAGAGRHEVALRQPMAGEPLVADYAKIGGSVKWAIDLLPEPENVYIEIGRLEGNFVKTKVDKPQLESSADSSHHLDWRYR